MGKTIDNSKVVDNLARVVILMSRPEPTVILVENCISPPVSQLDIVPITPRTIRNIL